MDDEYDKILKELQDILESQDDEYANIIPNIKAKEKNKEKNKEKKSSNRSHDTIYMSEEKKTILLNEINNAIDCLKPIVDSLH